MSRVIATIGLILALPACFFCFAEFLLSLLIAVNVYRFGSFEGVRFTIPGILVEAAIFLVAGILLVWAIRRLLRKIEPSQYGIGA